MDFYEIKTEYVSKDKDKVIADFKVDPSDDLMVQGKSFYAIWNPDTGLWSKNEFDVVRIVDDSINKYIDENRGNSNKFLEPKYLSSYSSSSWTKYKKFIKEMPDCYKQLDTKVVFANTKVKKTDYASRRLPYAMEEGSIDAYNELMTILYEAEEREIIEWAIGAIISGDSKKIQKFIGLYGEPGTGKSTILNIIETLFDGYCVAFNAKELVSNNNAFAGDAFATNPLVGVQHDGDLSKIVDNSLLNTIVSHEKIIINEKFKSKFEVKPNTFLFIASNEPFMITNQNSGMKRRLIDVLPTGNRVEKNRYNELMDQIYKDELGHIAYHCLEVYKKLGKHKYDDREPRDMMRKTDPFYNFVMDNIALSSDILKTNSISVKEAFNIYKRAYDNGEILFKWPMYKIREELIPYFNEYVDKQHRNDKGERVGATYYGLKEYLFERTRKDVSSKKEKPVTDSDWLKLKKQKSKLDMFMKDMPAQYALELRDGRWIPKTKWETVKTTLKDLDTSKHHYINCPAKYICIDFDIKDSNGNKNKNLNIEAAKDFPPTYAEYSQGGEGLHLHYIYTGDTEILNSKYDEDIEIKVYDGNGALRRRLTECNDLNIAYLDSGFLPLKEKKKVIKDGVVKNEQVLRIMIQKNLNKEVHSDTTSSIHFIKKLLDDAIDDEIKFDVTDLRPKIMAFAANATNQSEHCLEVVSEMKFSNIENDDLSIIDEPDIKVIPPIAFYDVEVFPNLFVVNYKFPGKDNPVIRLINPSPSDIEIIMKYRLVGFNCRKYDNHIIYAAYQGYNNLELFNLSQRIINNSPNCYISTAWNLSYADIYDYAAKKQSLKKWEIELGIHHQELGLPWDKPVPKNLWDKVAEYCDNDVIATEAVWDATQGDFAAREILAEIAGGLPNETTNTLSTRFIFGDNKNPQDEFNYRNLGEPEIGQTVTDKFGDGISHFQENGKPVFVGYEFDRFSNKSSYQDIDDVGEGGYVYAKPGMYSNVWTFDVASMHPSSVIAENLFGDKYTKRFADILQLRIYIKHKEFDKARKMFDGRLAKYLDDPKLAKALAQALKIVINSVYGLTAASFSNPFRDERNIDNIVAKRGALFMINLRILVERMGYTVVHVKTDSIKVANPDKKIIKFINDYGKAYGYNFEIEHKFEKICLVNNAVYIAKLSEDDEEWLEDCSKAKEKGSPEPTRWTATGTQFAVPYVFKTLFSGEPIKFEDFCETKSVSKGELYLDRNEDMKDVTSLEKALETYGKIQRGVKVTNKAKEELNALGDITEEELKKKIAKGHNYNFVGKVGSFVPVSDGSGGGILYRYDAEKDKYYAATGSDGYRWLEAEYVKDLKIEDCVNKSYHQNLVDDAVDSISQYGDFEWFAS